MNNVFFITRFGKGHLINYKSFDGKYITVCSRAFKIDECVNILATDSNCPILCNVCSDYINMKYNLMLNRSIRTAFNSQSPMFKCFRFSLLLLEAHKSLFRDWHKLNLKLAKSKLIR
ncbi:hypothetical protein UFOVP1290_542 [uncultured Caudovirales phage]|uniref:Uncharacterized protein n=1 Tax=uncultured Caudovirales phage TaxID=2100421 RepID=A0A6J5RLU0_9CAUD|nr:hypothetical protein UFOVP1290_542 [uncultured Caudovirales phage]